MTQFVDQHEHEFGVEPICRTSQVAPSSAPCEPPARTE